MYTVDICALYDILTILCPSDGLPSQAGQGGAFYDFFKDTVTNTISNLFPPNGQGEWPGAFDPREVRSMQEKMTEKFPEIIKDKRFNMKKLLSKAGKFIRGRRYMA
jgi:hypothetical protein